MPERYVAALCINVNDPENNISLHRRFLNLRHRHQSRGHFEHVILVISGRGRPRENRILNFVKTQKNCVLSKSKNFFRRSSLGEMWNWMSEKKFWHYGHFNTFYFRCPPHNLSQLDFDLHNYVHLVCSRRLSDWLFVCELCSVGHNFR